MAKLGPGLGTLLWAFINATWTTARRKDFWSLFGYAHNWCSRQKYENPRLSAFMIKLQYHFLPLRLNLLNQRLPCICCMLWWQWGCDTFTLPLPCFQRFPFPTGTTLTVWLPIVTTLLSFHRISSIWSPDVKYWYSLLSIFLNSLTHFNEKPFVLSARKVPVALTPSSERVFMSWYGKEVVEKDMVIWRISSGESDDVITR